MSQLYPESSPPIRCPKCGQLNAGSSTVCVVCKTPLDPLSAGPVWPWEEEPAPGQRIDASLREHREIIAMYVRWCGYATTIFGIVLLLSPLLFCYGLASVGSTLGIGVFGPIAAICLYILWQAPKVKKGLIRGETWPFEIVIRIHLGLYVVLGMMMLGVVALALDSPSSENGMDWGPLLCLESPLVVGMIINWYALQAFEWTIGRRDRLRRFTPLSSSGERTTGVKVYTYLMILVCIVMMGSIAASVYERVKEDPDDPLRTIGGSTVAGLLTLALPLALAYGVWMRRAWGRLLAMAFHALVGLMLILLIVGVIPSASGGTAPYIGNFFINLAVFNWFYSHTDYFDR